jgi:hypothetical protein
MAGARKGPGALFTSEERVAANRLPASRQARRLQVSIAKAGKEVFDSAGSCDSGFTRGLSRMTRKCHVRFLGEPGAHKGPRFTRCASRRDVVSAMDNPLRRSS